MVRSRLARGVNESSRTPRMVAAERYAIAAQSYPETAVGQKGPGLTQQREYQFRTIGLPMKLAVPCAVSPSALWWRVLVTCLLAASTSAVAQDLADICGCGRDSTLKAFNAGDPSTYPAGTTGCTAACESGTITLAIPADAILRFSSFTAPGAFTIGF